MLLHSELTSDEVFIIPFAGHARNLEAPFTSDVYEWDSNSS